MIRFLDAAGLAQPIYAVECDGARYGVEEVAMMLRVQAELVRLRVLHEDMERWRASGDARDLLYVLETMDKIDAARE